MVEICWRQKSRALWIREGDRNTKFFHRIANSHRRFNTIDNLLVEGELTSDPNSISACISHFYKQLYLENKGVRPVLDEVDFSMISEVEAAWLDRPFEEEEVFGVIQGCNGDKSAGLDGFSMAFFKVCWDFLKLEIMEVLANFHSQVVFEKSLNATFIALIPKKVDAVNVRDFRPISLVGSIYKIISKLLANRLRRVIFGIISESQNAFVLDRQILDSVLIAIEFLDSRLKDRGLCQGDPLSSLLFAIVMEALSSLLDGAVLAGHILGFIVGTRSNTPLMVTHLLFADNTLIFCDASASQVEYLREILASFEAVSGLHINLAKSELVPIGEVTNMGKLVALLGCS